MALEDLLVLTAEVRRREADDAGDPVRDDFGQVVDANPSLFTAREPAATFPCRVRRDSGGRQEGERMTDVFENRATMYCLPDADVTELDSVRVVDADGREVVVDAKVGNINVVYGSEQAPDHLEVTLVTQRGPH